MALRFGNQVGVSGLILDDQAAFTSTANVFGVGAAVAQSAVVAGAGIRTVVDLGTPPEFFSGIGTVVGSGEVIHVGTGAPQAQSAVVVGVGVGIVNITGSGVLAAAVATASASGFVGIGGSGVLQAQQSIAVGTGGQPGVVFGAGTLLAGRSVAVGVGERSIKGAGVLNVSVSLASGAGLVIEIASDYVSWLKPNTIQIEALSFSVDYAEVTARNRLVPGSVVIGWDDLVAFHEDNRVETRVAYKFSSGKNFVEDDD